jgi:flagellar hook-associated protein 2
VATPNGAIEIAKVFTGDTGLITRMNKATEQYVGTTGSAGHSRHGLEQQADRSDHPASGPGPAHGVALQTTLSAKYTPWTP